MSNSLLMRLPGVTDFIESVVRDVNQQRSVVIYLPDTFDLLALWSQIWSHLSRVDLPSINLYPKSGSDPLKVIWEANSSLPQDQAFTIGTIFKTDDTAALYCIHDLGNLPEKDQERWAELIQRWAQISQQQSGKSDSRDRTDDLPRLLALVPAGAVKARIDSDVRLNIRYWTGIPSKLEGQLLCRSNGNVILGQESQRWREYLLPDLFSGDAALLEYLWDKIMDCGTDHDLCQLLCDYAASRQWTTADVEKVCAPRAVSQNGVSNLTGDEYRYWSRGWLYQSPEYGWEVHTAVLALLDRKQDVRRRLWRGQAHLLLPLLDSYRLTVIEKINARHGTEWPKRWLTQENTSSQNRPPEDPYEVEWGQIYWLQHEYLELQQDRLLQDNSLKALTRCARKVRNHIAHFQPVEFSDYETLTSYYRKWQASVA